MPQAPPLLLLRVAGAPGPRTRVRTRYELEYMYPAGKFLKCGRACPPPTCLPVEVSVLGQGCEALVTRYGDLVIVAQP